MIAIFVLLGLVAVALAVAATRPATMRIERAIDVAAPAERIFPLLNDFHEWRGWSPWEELDPNLQRTYGGPASGAGANYAWIGNKKVGEGRMEIMESSPETHVKIALQFIKPFPANNTVDLTLTPSPAGTHVRWVMTGASPFMMRVFGLFVNMDAMIGKDFEKGLAGIKRLAEAQAPTR